MSKRLFALFLMGILTGCHLGPDYEVPPVEVPEEWKAPYVSIPPPKIDFWWEVFGDELLNALEKEALQNNPSLFAALERVIEARAMAGVTRADLYPQLVLNPNFNNTMYLTRFQIPAANNLPAEDQTFRLKQTIYSLPLDLSYQLDLFGSYSGQYHSAVYHAQSEEEAYFAAILTLTSDLASAYFQMRALDAQIDLLRATKKIRKEAYEVNQARWEGGLVNYTDVSRAALEYTNAEAENYDAIRQRNIQENQIAALIGTPASYLTLAHNPLKEAPPQVPPSLPSSVLLNRPDIAEAERQMAREQALIGVAYAAFFPEVTLTGTLGYLSPDLRHFLSWKSRLWAYGTDIVQSLFDGGRNLSNLDVSYANFYEASGNYQNQVLTAFKEVENALSDIELQALQYASLESSVESAKLTTVLSTDRYNKGLVNYLEVVDSERAELEVERTAIDLLGLRYISTIQLIKALGGTWSQQDACE